MPNITPYGTLIILLAIMGAATLATWSLSMLGEVMATAAPKLKQAMVRWQANRALRRSLRMTPRMSVRERDAMERGAMEAVAAFERAQLAMARH